MAGKHRKSSRHSLSFDREPVKPYKLARYTADHGSHYDWASVPFRLGLAVFVIALLAVAATGVRVVPEDPPVAVTVAAVVQADVPAGSCGWSR